MHDRIPSLNWLRVFETAARFQNFAKAAEALNMSAPAVSQQIKALETYLRRDLFVRGGRSVQLTEAGRNLVPVVGRAIADLEAATGGMVARQGRETLTLRVSSMFAASWLMPRLHRFFDLYPEIGISVASGVNDSDFWRTDVDAKITFGLPPGPGERGERLMSETIYPVASPHAAAQVRSASDLIHWPLIEISTHRANWQHVFAEAGVTTPRHLRMHYTDTTALAFATVASGKSIALARSPATDDLARRYGLVPCLEDFELPGFLSYYFVCKDDLWNRSVIRKFSTWLTDEVH